MRQRARLGGVQDLARGVLPVVGVSQAVGSFGDAERAAIDEEELGLAVVVVADGGQFAGEPFPHVERGPAPGRGAGEQATEQLGQTGIEVRHEVDATGAHDRIGALEQERLRLALGSGGIHATTSSGKTSMMEVPRTNSCTRRPSDHQSQAHREVPVGWRQASVASGGMWNGSSSSETGPEVSSGPA